MRSYDPYKAHQKREDVIHGFTVGAGAALAVVILAVLILTIKYQP